MTVVNFDNYTNEGLHVLMFEIDRELRNRRMANVIFYFNNLYRYDPDVCRLALDKYKLLCEERACYKRAHVMDRLLDDIETLTGLD